jgi:tetratricopeptide (TPR) repeat protein
MRVEDYSTAATALESIVREDPRYRDAARRLEEVRQAQAERARVAFDAAMALEQDEELIKARSALERTCTMAQPPSACAEASKRIAEKIQTAGNEAFRRARSFDGQGRLPEAIALYERAVQFLAADDANRQIAKERLDFLKSRR